MDKKTFLEIECVNHWVDNVLSELHVIKDGKKERPPEHTEGPDNKEYLGY